MTDNYLCPKEHPYYCTSKGCLTKTAECGNTTVASGKPGYKTTNTPSLKMIESKSVSSQHLFNHLDNIIEWTKKDDDDQKRDLIRFCAKIENQCLWVKIVLGKKPNRGNLAYEKTRHEIAFFSKKLSNFTPHIVECAASRIFITGYINLVDSPQYTERNKIITKINSAIKDNSDLMCVFYVQPTNWVYLESFMDPNQNFLVTELMVLSILFQIVYTVACMNSMKIIHGNLSAPKTIVLDLDPREQQITYFRNDVRYEVTTKHKVIILNWEDVTKGDISTDMKNVCERFKQLIKEVNTVFNSSFLDDVTSADEFLKHEIFRPFLRVK